MQSAGDGGTKDGESCQKSSCPVISERRKLEARVDIVNEAGKKGRGSSKGAVVLPATGLACARPAGRSLFRLLRYEVVVSGRVIASTVGREVIREMSRRVSAVIPEPDQQGNHRGHGQVVDLL